MKKIKKIKESKVDAVFSLWIRNRDRRCVYPLRPGDHHSSVLQCSHFYGRGCRSVRFEPSNCDAICSRHHQFLEGRKNKEYYDFKLKQLGTRKFNTLKRKAYTLKQFTQPEYQALIKKYDTQTR
jgi:hypothetical protein